MSALYIAFVFYAKKTESKFFIFFISSFINIFNYSIILKNEYNFLSVVLLNLLFAFVIIFFYIYSDIGNNILPNDFVENSDFKNIMSVLIFLFSFFSICFIFCFTYFKKDAIKSFNINTNVINNVSFVMKEEDKLQHINIIDSNDIKYTIYNKNIKFIDNNKIFRNYNLIILCYIIILMISFVINDKSTSNER